jgi:uncharacterized HhH-GPD family protein
MMLDQQIPMERAFGAPYLLEARLGHPLDPVLGINDNPERVMEAFSEKPALHRFPKAMGERYLTLCRLIADEYGGVTSAIWSDDADAVTVLKRLTALPGFGEQKARIFLALLAKRIGITPHGWREATEPFGQEGSFFSVADVDSPEAFEKVRTHKAEMKQKRS